MKKLIFIMTTLFGFASVQAQTVSYPHELFDPLGIPQVEGAKLLHVDKKESLIMYQATQQQVLDWIEQMDNLGFLHQNRYEESKKNIRRGTAYKGQSHLNYYFPVGTKGDKQNVHVSMACNFVGDISIMRYKKIPGSTMVIQLTPHSPDKMELDYKKGVLNPIGITDESGFIPKHTREINVELATSTKSLIPQWEEGSPWYAVVRAKFVTGYIPTIADVRAWAEKLYKACAQNASSINPMQGRDIQGSTPNLSLITGRTTHWWTYTNQGITYECYVNAELDLFGQFWFDIKRKM